MRSSWAAALSSPCFARCFVQDRTSRNSYLWAFLVGETVQTGKISHADLTLSFFRFASFCVGEPDYSAGFGIIYRKLRQQSESVLSGYPGVDY